MTGDIQLKDSPGSIRIERFTAAGDIQLKDIPGSIRIERFTDNEGVKYW